MKRDHYKIRRAVQPWSKEVAQIAKDIGRAPWILEWKTSLMPGMSFYIFTTRADARECVRRRRAS